MPKNIFRVIAPNVRHLLGGAKVELLGEQADIDEAKVTKDMFVKKVKVGGKTFTFKVERPHIGFTSSEKRMLRELLESFRSLIDGFSNESYAFHFRTALLTSLMDISVARYLRKPDAKAFWNIQYLIQILKKLSYQRYEGAPVTTGFVVYRSLLPTFLKVVESQEHEFIKFDQRYKVSPKFFDSPLSYRLVDGNNAIYAVDIEMIVKGLVRFDITANFDAIDRLTYRRTVNILNAFKNTSFGIYINNLSEIEVIVDSNKILLWRKGLWAMFDCAIFSNFLSDSCSGDWADDLIWSLYALSRTRHGTVVLIGDIDQNTLKNIKKSSAGGKDSLSKALIGSIKNRPLRELKKSGELLRVLSSDGLTIISKEGELIDTGVIIDVSQADKLVSGGGRTTAASAASKFGKVIKVSEDGPIELYLNGKSIYRFG